MPLRKQINSLRLRPYRHHFADDIFKCIFEKENELISPRISLKFVPKVRINNIPALVQIMAWCRPGNKPLSEPMMASLLTHIWVTQPQWVNLLDPGGCGCNLEWIIFKLISMIEILNISCEIALMCPTLTWYHQATSHYLGKWWPRSMSPCGITS